MIVPASQKADYERIMACDDAGQLIEQLKEALSITLAGVVTSAAIVKRCDELGIDIEARLGCRLAILPVLRQIADGQILPELYVALHTRINLFRRAAALSHKEQRLIVENEPLKVMEEGGTHRVVAPLDLQPHEVSQVFAPGRLRNETEQVGHIKDQHRKVALKAAATVTDDAEPLIDRKRDGVWVGHKFISHRRWIEILGQLADR